MYRAGRLMDDLPLEMQPLVAVLNETQLRDAASLGPKT
jgi:hypothetical protein